jgi:antitoxin ParD1/3/4
VLYCTNSKQIGGVLVLINGTKNISLTDIQNEWIAAQIDAGRFTTDSEYIRDLIRREQERDGEFEAIRAALIAGE